MSDSIRMKGRGWTDEHVVDCVAYTLARSTPIEPMRREIAEVVEARPNNALEPAFI